MVRRPSLSVAAGTLAALCAAAACTAQATRPHAAPASRPAAATLEQIYADCRPDFLEVDRLRGGTPYKLSTQPYFYNMAQVEHDYRVDALLGKADELFAAGQFREAMKLYHEVVAHFPDDLWRIQPNGIFLRSALYAQRKLLQMPDDQILYYRTLHDAEARSLYERAKKYYSPLDFAELAERHLATSYGDDALWELGNSALDQGQHAKALFYFRQIRDTCTLSDIPAGELALRLAACCRRLGREAEYQQARQTAERDARPDDRAQAEAFLRQIDAVRPPAPGPFRQARKDEYVSLGDYQLLPDPAEPIDRRQFVWSEPHPDARGQWYTEALPWIAGNSVYYRHHNALFSRSLLTGKLNWSFQPGGLIDWFQVAGPARWHAQRMLWHPESDLLVHDGVVFASILKDGPSLVAVDRLTGQLRWARGALASVDEPERGTRYLTAPAAGPGVVYAPYVFEDIGGSAHLNSRMGVACFDAADGRLLWRRQICLLTPPKMSTSKFVRRIRVYGTQPTVRDGVLYHTTNAGIVAALDALSGSVLWATRYPHSESIHDLLEEHGPLWYARPPLWIGGRLLVTPVDCERLLCFEAATGKVLWSRPREQFQTLVGVNSTGQVVLTGTDRLAGIDPATGATLWSRPCVPADVNARLASGGVTGRPILTRGDRIYFDTASEHRIRAEQFWDMRTKKTVAQRWYYDTDVYSPMNKYNEEVRRRAEREGRSPAPDEFVQNTTTPFTNFCRMPFERFGTVFELQCAPGGVSLWYDRDSVARAVAADDSPQGLYSRAELAEVDGDRGAAIRLYEQARRGLPAWDTPLRTEINRQLFRLYRRQAEAAAREADWTAAERFCYQMASVCTRSDDEIFVILSMAEVFRRQQRWDQSAACLAGVAKHYSKVKFGIPAVLTGDRPALEATAAALLANLRRHTPRQFYGGEFDLAARGAEAMLDDYFCLLSPLEPEVEVEAGTLAGRQLRDLFARAPADFRARVERAAEAALEGMGGVDDVDVLARRIDQFPGTKAAQAAIDRLIAKARALAEPDRRIALWRARDLAVVNDLQVPADVTAACNIRVGPPAAGPLRPPYRSSITELPYDPQTQTVLLARDGEPAGGEHLAMIGIRSVQRNANKFAVCCWDLAADAKKWQTAELRLEGKGDEEGFAKFFLRGGLVVVHGWYDVIALSLADGAVRWRFRVPHGFRIQESAAAEDVLVLLDQNRTLALHLAGGQLIWEANETGALYWRPCLRDNLLATVRRNPSGVAFRSLGTGRLLEYIRLRSLCEATENPAVAWATRTVPAAAAGDTLVLTDGWDFIAVDLDAHKVRWQRRIEQIDRYEPAGYRFWLDGGTLVALKPDYDSLGMSAIRLDDGEQLWHVNEAKSPGVLYDAVAGGGRVFGLHDNPDDPSSIHLLGYGLADGRRGMRADRPGKLSPQAELDPALHGDFLLARISDGQDRSLLIADCRAGKVVQMIDATGFGSWGEYGQVSCAVAAPYMALLCDKKLIVLQPADGGKTDEP